MKDFLITDFEFTMYRRPVGRPNGFFSEIIEIGAVRFNAAQERTGEIQNFVKPHFYPRQAKEGMEFSMITEKDMKTGIEFPDMLARLGGLYEVEKTFFVTWGDADYRVLNTGCEHHKLPNPIRAEDCLDLALAYRLWKGDDYTTGLKRATEELEIKPEGLQHTALDDAINTGKVLFKMMEKGWTPEQFFAGREEYIAGLKERQERKRERRASRK